MILRWNCLKHKDKLLVRKFYLHSVSQAYKMTSLDELCTLFEAILAMTLSEYVGVNERNGEELPSESRLQYLNTTIKSVATPELSNDTDESLHNNYTSDSEEVNNKEPSNGFQWSANIFENVKQLAINCTGTENSHKCLF